MNNNNNHAILVHQSVDPGVSGLDLNNNNNENNNNGDPAEPINAAHHPSNQMRSADHTDANDQSLLDRLMTLENETSNNTALRPNIQSNAEVVHNSTETEHKVDVENGDNDNNMNEPENFIVFRAVIRRVGIAGLDGGTEEHQ